uniref:Diacylglycerol kinase n=1 Tax=Pseudonaja textilis TaxID=8673 RepID=A0A670Y9A8_PSETE
MAEGARSVLGGSPASSPLMGRGGKSHSLPTPSSSSSSSTSLQQHQHQTPPASPKQPPPPPPAAARGSPPGHCFKRVTLTKPTFCHYCTDFIWGLAGYLCEVCNFMSHEKCLKYVKIPCSSIAPSLVRVPVAHCLGPIGHYKRKFCSVCRKQLESPAFRCEVCEIHVHTDCAPFACSDCRQCHQDGHQNHDMYHHHWREGNLPSGSRCKVCKKTCGSSDVLSGMRCEWCGILAHAACCVIVPPECTFGRLRNMILPPSCVRLFCRNFSKMHCFRISESIQAEPGKLLCGTAAVEKARKKMLFQTFHSKQMLKIYDGNDAVKRNQYRLITVPRIAKNEEVVEAALRAYYISDDQQDYELQTFTQQALFFIFFSSFMVWELCFGTDGTMVIEVLTFSPYEMCFKVMKCNFFLTQTSLRQMNQTRFYIVENNISTVRVHLFVGGLPLHLTTEEYTKILKDELAIKTNVVSMSHIYSSQGAVVLEITCFSEAERLYMLVKDTFINDKALTAVILPEILQNKLPQNCCPLLVFVNPKSGGLKGRNLLYSFRKLLNPHQIFELTNGGPLPGFHTFSQIPYFRILVCGGDGTVGWVLGALEEIRHKLACPEPSVAILPLGTGNDLGRVLRWGAGYSGEDPYSILISVDEADDVLMDRWTILLDAQEALESSENGVSEPEPPKIVQMNNYCGLGIDAELSLGFHHAREEEPDKFNSRLHNKGVYVKVGLQKMSHTRSLHKEIKLQVDQHEVELPSIEGLIFINIPSWGSGADLWGSDNDNRFEKPKIDDGLLEVVGVTGVVHMGQVQGGLRSGIRIAQGSYFRVTLRKPIPVQVDGEPWIQPPGQMIISAAGPKVHMLKKSKQKQKKTGNTKDSRTESTLTDEAGH